MIPDVIHVPVTRDAALHVERYGLGGPPLILLHGFGTCAFYWRAVAAALAPGHTVFAIDLLGYGESDRPERARYDIASQAEVLEAALTELRVARAPIIGNDVGGNVAIRLAAGRPERVESLVLVNTVLDPPIDRGPLRSLRLATARHAVRLARSVTGAAPLLQRYLEGAVADRAAMSPRLVARYLAPYVGTSGADHLIALARTIGEESWEPELVEAVEAPALYVWGDADPTLDPAEVERAAARLRHGRLLVIPHAGRLVAEDAPDALVSAVREHLARLRRI